MTDDPFVGYDEYESRGWDGDDAEPINRDTLEAARLLYGHLKQPPDVSPGADGTIGFQWSLADGRFLIIEIGPGQIYQARIVGAFLLRLLDAAARRVEALEADVSRLRALAAAERAGAEKMREQAAQQAERQATNTNGLRPLEWVESAQFVAGAIRALPLPGEK